MDCRTRSAARTFVAGRDCRRASWDSALVQRSRPPRHWFLRSLDHLCREFATDRLACARTVPGITDKEKPERLTDWRSARRNLRRAAAVGHARVMAFVSIVGDPNCCVEPEPARADCNRLVRNSDRTCRVVCASSKAERGLL